VQDASDPAAIAALTRLASNPKLGPLIERLEQDRNVTVSIDESPPLKDLIDAGGAKTDIDPGDPNTLNVRYNYNAVSKCGGKARFPRHVLAYPSRTTSGRWGSSGRMSSRALLLTSLAVGLLTGTLACKPRQPPRGPAPPVNLALFRHYTNELWQDEQTCRRACATGSCWEKEGDWMCVRHCRADAQCPPGTLCNCFGDGCTTQLLSALSGGLPDVCLKRMPSPDAASHRRRRDGGREE